MKDIASCSIHPAIGIARVGNSPMGYFIGPETPGVIVHPPGGYKDGAHGDQVKRQAARFRVFARDAAGNVLGEITAADAKIQWRVTLANKKSEWDNFDGGKGEELPIHDRRPRAEWRNKDIFEEVERQRLIIAPEPAVLERPGARHVFDDGTFMGVKVTLGEARLEPIGRLLVLAGCGRSESVEEGRRISHYANNDRWFDDIADGPVEAEVTLLDGRVFKANPAWVITAPPDFSPETPNPVTLLDVALQTAYEHLNQNPPTKTSYCLDVLPILRSAISIMWTSGDANGAHSSWASRVDLKMLASPAEGRRAHREAIFKVLRNPFATGDEAKAQANRKFMPALAGDEGDCEDGESDKWLVLTETQYAHMQRWAKGDFASDWPPAVKDVAQVTPDGLDRAALEACSGGAFYPGIEAGWIFRKAEAFAEPLRFNADLLAAGDVTKRMAVPWQADFFECNTWWWPAQRPDDVLPLAALERIRVIDQALANERLGDVGSDKVVRTQLQREREELVSRRVPWARHLPKQIYAGDNAMVSEWSKLGFVTSQLPDGSSALADGGLVLVESEASAVVVTDPENLAEWFHRLINIERFPAYRKPARELALQFFAGADYADPNYQSFEFSVEAFRQRLDKIYNDFVAEIDEPHWLEALPREAVVENLLQKAPMNMTDGAWLHHILSAGPTGEVRSKLFEIWSDEAGNGHTELNHSNIYDTLLRSLHVFLPPITSRDFIELDLLPGAWENAVFQLSVGLFPEEFFPELLGMTLYLEWEATPTMIPVARMLRKHGIDPQFYAMHAAIDNVTAGHGALAREAVEIHLNEVQTHSGQAAMQREWKRVWNGYVTWATVGSFGSQLGEYLERKYVSSGADFTRERMIKLVRQKAPYAQTAHGTAVLGGVALGSLFAEPERLLDALVAEKWVNPAAPRESKFVTKLLGFHGPMYKVFTPEEFNVILDWVESLAGPTPAPEPGPVSAPEQVAVIIRALMVQAQQEPAHARSTLKLKDGRSISVADLFASGDVVKVMGDLAGSDMIVPNDPAASPLIRDVFKVQMANVLELDEVAVFEEWIRTGCRMPGALLKRTLALRNLVSLVELSAENLTSLTKVPFARRRQFIGAGSVH